MSTVSRKKKPGKKPSVKSQGYVRVKVHSPPLFHKTFPKITPNEIPDKHKNKLMWQSYFFIFRRLKNNVTCFFMNNRNSNKFTLWGQGGGVGVGYRRGLLEPQNNVNTVKSTTQKVRVFKSNRIFGTNHSNTNRLQKTNDHKKNEQSTKYSN